MWKRYSDERGMLLWLIVWLVRMLEVELWSQLNSELPYHIDVFFHWIPLVEINYIWQNKIFVEQTKTTLFLELWEKNLNVHHNPSAICRQFNGSTCRTIFDTYQYNYYNHYYGKLEFNSGAVPMETGSRRRLMASLPHCAVSYRMYYILIIRMCCCSSTCSTD